MKIEDEGSTLRVSDLSELSVQNAAQFRAQVQSALSPSLTSIDIDLAGTQFVDSCGLASLCSLRAAAAPKGISVRLINPEPPTHQLLELTQMHELFEIVSSEPVWSESSAVSTPAASSPSHLGVSAPLHFL